MLCTRCQQRNATHFRGLSVEGRAKCQAMFGVPWPFPENVCDECTRDIFKDPEFLARWEPFMKGVKAWNAREWAHTKDDLRESVLKVLDFADNLAGKF